MTNEFLFGYHCWDFLCAIAIEFTSNLKRNLYVLQLGYIYEYVLALHSYSVVLHIICENPTISTGNSDNNISNFIIIIKVEISNNKIQV